ncbi:MAG: tetratricopeptide repeat protein [Armatimonadota bacterium]
MDTPFPTRARRGLGLTLAASAMLVLAGPQSLSAAPAKSRSAAKAPAPAADPFTRGKELFKQGKLADALAAFQEAEKKSPKDAVVQSWLGFVHFKLRRHDEAIQHLRASLELSPNDPDTYNNLGNAYLAKGEVEPAIAAYQQAVEKVKDRPGGQSDFHYNLGNALVKKGDLDAALASFQEAERQAPKDALVQNNLGYVYERKYAALPDPKMLEKAVAHYRKATELAPKSAVFYRNLGLAARRQEGGAAEAVTALTRAVELDARDFSSHLALAEEHQAAGKTAEAIASYRSAIGLRPNEFVPRYNLGLLYARQAAQTGNNTQRLRHYNSSLVELQQAVKIEPKDPRALSAMGYVCFKAGKTKDAAEWYRKALEVAPDSQAAHANLGLVLERLANPEGAIRHWREAVRLDPADAETRVLLASAYLSQGMHEEAVAEYREVLKLKQDGSVYNNLGFALEKLSRTDEAIAAYKQAVEANPKLAVAHNNLGACYARQGQKDLARQHYQKALEIDPKFADAKKNLDRLGGS